MADSGKTHESFDRNETIQGSSDRAFGIVFTVVFLLIGSWSLIWGDTVWWWAFAVAAIFLIAAFVIPKALAPLNRAWM